MKQRRTPRRLAVESLENRSLLAGNVLATVDDAGLLTITGDDAGNRIVIEQLPASGPTSPWPGVRYSIASAWTRPGQEPTTINGQSTAIVEGVKSVDIAMNDGIDSVYVHNPNRANSIASLPGIVNIDMGNNNSSTDSQTEGLTLYAENHQEINIQLGRGIDYLGMRGAVHKLTVVGDSLFQAGDPPAPPAHDTIDLGITAGGPVSIDSKYGNDKVLLRSFVARNSTAAVTINSGGGDDSVRVTLGSARFKAPLRIETGDGNDRVLVSNVAEATVVTVNTGRGNDDIWVQSSPVVFPKLSVWAGEGDDRVVLHGVKSAKTVLGGGDGTDTLQTFKNYPSDLGEATVTGFEVFEENPI